MEKQVVRGWFFFVGRGEGGGASNQSFGKCDGMECLVWATQRVEGDIGKGGRVGRLANNSKKKNDAEKGE